MPSPLVSERYQAAIQVLREARMAAGVTQVQLAERLSRPQSYVSKIERHERRADILDFYDWAEALGLRPTMLLEAVEVRLTKRP